MAVQHPSPIWRTLRNLTLLGVIAALGYLNWRIWTTQADIRPIAVDQSAVPARTTSSEVTGHVDSKPEKARIYTETLARPIFRADRKPFVAAVEPPTPVVEVAAEPPPPAPAIEPPQALKLIGVMRDGNGQDLVLVRSTLSPAASWLGVGDKIEGWEISAINQSSMTLSTEASSFTLNLYPATGTQSDTAAP